MLLADNASAAAHTANSRRWPLCGLDDRLVTTTTRALALGLTLVDDAARHRGCHAIAWCCRSGVVYIATVRRCQMSGLIVWLVATGAQEAVEDPPARIVAGGSEMVLGCKGLFHKMGGLLSK